MLLLQLLFFSGLFCLVGLLVGGWIQVREARRLRENLLQETGAALGRQREALGSLEGRVVRLVGNLDERGRGVATLLREQDQHVETLNRALYEHQGLIPPGEPGQGDDSLAEELGSILNEWHESGGNAELLQSIESWERDLQTVQLGNQGEIKRQSGAIEEICRTLRAIDPVTNGSATVQAEVQELQREHDFSAAKNATTVAGLEQKIGQLEADLTDACTAAEESEAEALAEDGGEPSKSEEFHDLELSNLSNEIWQLTRCLEDSKREALIADEILSGSQSELAEAQTALEQSQRQEAELVEQLAEAQTGCEEQSADASLQDDAEEPTGTSEEESEELGSSASSILAELEKLSAERAEELVEMTAGVDTLREKWQALDDAYAKVYEERVEYDLAVIDAREQVLLAEKTVADISELVADPEQTVLLAKAQAVLTDQTARATKLTSEVWGICYREEVAINKANRLREELTQREEQLAVAAALLQAAQERRHAFTAKSGDEDASVVDPAIEGALAQLIAEVATLTSEVWTISQREETAIRAKEKVSVELASTQAMLIEIQGHEAELDEELSEARERIESIAQDVGREAYQAAQNADLAAEHEARVARREAELAELDTELEPMLHAVQALEETACKVQEEMRLNDRDLQQAKEQLTQAQQQASEAVQVDGAESLADSDGETQSVDLVAEHQANVSQLTSAVWTLCQRESTAEAAASKQRKALEEREEERSQAVARLAEARAEQAAATAGTTAPAVESTDGEAAQQSAAIEDERPVEVERLAAELQEVQAELSRDREEALRHERSATECIAELMGHIAQLDVQPAGSPEAAERLAELERSTEDRNREHERETSALEERVEFLSGEADRARGLNGRLVQWQNRCKDAEDRSRGLDENLNEALEKHTAEQLELSEKLSSQQTRIEELEPCEARATDLEVELGSLQAELCVEHEQLGALEEKEAEQAEELGVQEQRLADLEIALKHVSAAAERVKEDGTRQQSEMDLQVADLRTQLEARKRELQVREEELVKERELGEMHADELSAREADVERMRVERDAGAERLHFVEEEHAELIERSEREISGLNSRLEQKALLLKDLESKHAKTARSHETAAQKVEEQRNELKRRADRIRRLDSNATRYREALAVGEGELEQATSQLNAAQTEVGDLRGTLVDRERALGEAQLAFEGLRPMLSSLGSNLGQALPAQKAASEPSVKDSPSADADHSDAESVGS